MAEAKAGRFDDAIATFSKGHKLYPQDVRFLTELAGAEYLKKDNGAARHWLLEAVKLAPTDAYVNEFLGTLYQIDGNLAATLKYWNRVNKPFLSGVTFPTNAGLDPAFRDRIFLFSAGQVFTLSRLEQSEANLNRAGVLTSTRIDLIPVPGRNAYQAIVQMQPIAIPLKGWLAWLLPPLRELPYQGLGFDRYDIHGRGANLTSLWRWDPDKRRAELEWRAPVRGNPRSEYQLWFDARDERWDLKLMPQLKLRSAVLGGNYIASLNGRLQWTIGGRLERHLFSEPEFGHAWQAMLINRFDYALWQWPEHRLTTSAWGSLNVGRLFGTTDSRLVVTRGGFSGEWFPEPKGETYRLTSQLQAGRIFGTPPVDELFQLGMERDTERDLWLRGILSAADGLKGTGLLGREYAITQTTFERQFFHIPFVTISAGPFFDVGRTWSAPFNLRPGPLTFDTGPQLDIKTVGGVGLTLVYGRDFQSGRGAFYSAVSR